ncbi:hypothetical protein PENTCL1PPCAC_19625, partial [Pristionchus entomophagus]
QHDSDARMMNFDTFFPTYSERPRNVFKAPLPPIFNHHCNVKRLIELADAFSSGISPSQEQAELVSQLLADITAKYADKMTGDGNFLPDNEDYETEYSNLAWTGLLVESRLSQLPFDFVLSYVDKFDKILTRFVELARPIRPPPLHENVEEWTRFTNYYTSVTRTMSATRKEKAKIPAKAMMEGLGMFCEKELRPCIESYRTLAFNHSNRLIARLRRAEIDRLAGLPSEVEYFESAAIAMYHNIMTTLCCFSIIIKDFRNDLHKFYRIHIDSIPVTEEHLHLLTTIENLLCDCLFSPQLHMNPVLVTNNLFSFSCISLACSILYREFTVHVISEETAKELQDQMRPIKLGSLGRGSQLKATSAALIAIKPVSGVKRNNATVCPEGGNTAHKKSDVNSREFVPLEPTFHEEKLCWTANYPHLLCTTRQKDQEPKNMILASKNAGRRPIFYFYICGAFYSTLGGLNYSQTFGQAFAIATRRNQDCQVQRMTSSYTATCFWMYGASQLKGSILDFSEGTITWHRFKMLLQKYLRIAGEATREFSDDELEMLQGKMQCCECSDSGREKDGTPLVAYKNLLCPHLRYDHCQPSTSTESVDDEMNESSNDAPAQTRDLRISVWRGVLEILQFFTDPKTAVPELWEDGVLHGFNYVDLMSERMSQLTATSLACYLSMANGGSVCFVVRRRDGSIVHLDPIDLKKLQIKPLTEYLWDIGTDEKVATVLTGHGEIVPFQSLKMEAVMLRSRQYVAIRSNITHSGSSERVMDTSFKGIHVAVVTCDKKPAEVNGLASDVETLSRTEEPKTRENFEKRLQELANDYGLSLRDVSTIVGRLAPVPRRFAPCRRQCCAAPAATTDAAAAQTVSLTEAGNDRPVEIRDDQPELRYFPQMSGAIDERSMGEEIMDSVPGSSLEVFVPSVAAHPAMRIHDRGDPRQSVIRHAQSPPVIYANPYQYSSPFRIDTPMQLNDEYQAVHAFFDSATPRLDSRCDQPDTAFESFMEFLSNDHADFPDLASVEMGSYGKR